MPKTSSTVHLEESTWKEIKEYMDQYGCSRNEAIERMFTERRLLINMSLKSNDEKAIDVVEDAILVKSDDNGIDEAVDSVYDEMPD